MLLLLVQPILSRSLVLTGQVAGLAREGGAAAPAEAIGGSSTQVDVGGGATSGMERAGGATSTTVYP